MKIFFAILKACLLVGTLDIVAAFIYYFIKTGSQPLPILKYIASGLFGQSAFSSGNSMYVYGLLLHYAIAFVFTSFFFLIYPKIKWMYNNKILTGILYGLAVWTLMNLVIVPLSNVTQQQIDVTNAIINMVILIVCIGLPLTVMANRFYTKKKVSA